MVLRVDPNINNISSFKLRVIKTAMELRPPKVKRISKFSSKNLVSYPRSLKILSNYFGSNAVCGKYNGSNVVINDPESAVAMYRLGCFGKGSLSRGEPNNHFRSSRNQQKSPFSEQNLGEKCHERFFENSDDRSEESIGLIGSQPTEHHGRKETEMSSEPSFREDCSLPNGVRDITMFRPEAQGFECQESLHLNLEEAYFLCFGLGCLEVVDLFDKKLTLQETWQLFCESQDDFVQKYVVYHHYRSKGWVVKPGLKFGGDFVLYKWGPSITHASYVVVIEVIRQDGTISDDVQLPITWMKFIGLNRMAETAGKEVVLCRVVWPQDVLFKDVRSPQDISKFALEEVLSRRWVPPQGRELLGREVE